MAGLAGQTFNSMMPRGLSSVFPGGLLGATAAGFVNPAALAALPLTSPRLMGLAMNGLGKGVGLLDKGTKWLPKSNSKKLLLGSLLANTTQ